MMYSQYLNTVIKGSETLTLTPQTSASTLFNETYTVLQPDFGLQ